MHSSGFRNNNSNMIVLKSYGYTAVIDPKRGGSCIRLSRYNAEILRTPSSAEDYKTTPFLYGTPLLFFPNRISEGTFEFDGRMYHLPINEPETNCFLHGTLHETPFEIINQNSDRVDLEYHATDEDPYLSFPHSFSIRLCWQLTEEGLSQRVTFTNYSDSKMPVALAFHTTFCLPFSTESNAEAVRMQLDTSIEYSRNMKNYLPDGGAFTEYPNKQDMEQGSFHPALYKMSRFFKMGERKELILTDPLTGVRARYKAIEGYDYWMVYNGVSKDFISVEPQSWLSNCPNAPFPRKETGFSFLNPDQCCTYETLLSIEHTGSQSS